MPFKASDVVVLRSGGPKMTIKSIEGDIALCAWFIENRLEEASIEIAAIKSPVPSGNRSIENLA